MLEELFEKVRKNQTVLFIGSGCSIAGNYPNASSFARTLYDRLSEVEKEGTLFTSDLAKIAQIYEDLRGRKELMNLVVDTFSFNAKNEIPIFHTILSTIPFWKTIVTTNYDSLIENAYKDEACNIICDDIQFSKSNEERKIRIVKIHGDINHTDDIIITSSDYSTKTYGDDVKHKLIWNFLKSEFASKSIIFVGYGYNDGNIENVIKSIQMILGGQMPTMYLVAPKIPLHHRKKMEKDGIVYIDMYDKDFIEMFKRDAEDKVVKELSDDNISETKTFMRHHNLSPYILSSGTRTKIVKIDSIDGTPLKESLNFNLLSQEGIEQVMAPNLNYDPSPVEIPADLVSNFNFSINGINFYKKDDVKRIMFVESPTYQAMVNVRFLGGKLYQGISIRTYGNGGRFSICIRLSIMDLSISNIANNWTQGEFGWKLSKRVPNVRKALSEVDLLMGVLGGNKFNVISKDLHINDLRVDNSGNALDFIRQIQLYYLNISVIQKAFRKSLQSFNNYNHDDEMKVMRIISYLNKEGLSYMSKQDITLRRTIVIPEKGKYLFLIKDISNDIVELFGYHFRLGFRYVAIPYIIEDSDIERLKSASPCFELKNRKYIVFNSKEDIDFAEGNLLIIPYSNLSGKGSDTLISNVRSFVENNNVMPL